LAKFLRSSDPRFAQEFEVIVQSRRDQSAGVQGVVRDIIEDVKARGDAALADYTARFDGLDLSKFGFNVRKSDLEKAYEGLTPDLKEALTLARSGSRPIIAGSCQKMGTTATPSAPSLGTAGRPSTPSVFMFQEARRATQARCS
jgi:histidinol dehydrogenase